jgi:sirohydrochlorin cobaltochelatase
VASLSDALVIIAHGSPDPAWSEPVDRLVRELERRLSSDAGARALVCKHLLSSGQDALDRRLTALASAGVTRIKFVSCFLSAGGRHLKRDIPALINDARARWPTLTIELLPGALGEDEQVITAMASATLRRAALLSS